ncbi:MAG: DNA polymerase III subunit delta' [Sulfuriflexus sp.]|nr:DNA polymerase III subunit delta' [Sulfuriflexus sp.]
MNLLPWQTEQWKQLVDRRRQGKLPHAILLSGSAGIGKHQFAELFAAGLICNKSNDDGSACGQCRSCLLLQAGNHPDMVRIEPEEVGKAIKVDQIRNLSSFTVLSAHVDGGYKVVLIDPAENMNKASANSLLKTLEEPAKNTVLLLVTSSPQRLLPTIRSRCQRIDFITPDHSSASAWLQAQQVSQPEQWLEIASGAPLTALQLSNSAEKEDKDIAKHYQTGLDTLEALLAQQQDPLSVATAWQKTNSLRAVGWLTNWVIDIIRLASLSTSANSAQKPPYMTCPSQLSRLKGLATQLDLDGLHGYLERLYETSRLLGTTQVNEQLLLEEILIRWTALPKNRL